MIKLDIKWGKGGLVIQHGTAFLHTIQETEDLVATTIRDARGTDINLLSFQVEFLKAWEIKKLQQEGMI